MTVGLLIVGASMLGLAAATFYSSIIGLIVAIGFAGLGLSWAAVTSTSSALQSLPSDRQGVASGAINTAAQIGTALGVAVLLSVAALTGRADGRIGFVIAFLCAAVLALTYPILLRTRRMPDTQ